MGWESIPNRPNLGKSSQLQDYIMVCTVDDVKDHLNPEGCTISLLAALVDNKGQLLTIARDISPPRSRLTTYMYVLMQPLNSLIR